MDAWCTIHDTWQQNSSWILNLVSYVLLLATYVSIIVRRINFANFELHNYIKDWLFVVNRYILCISKNKKLIKTNKKLKNEKTIHSSRNSPLFD